jgi:hypothetical protein
MECATGRPPGVQLGKSAFASVSDGRRDGLQELLEGVKATGSGWPHNAAGEGKSILKYFLLRQGGRIESEHVQRFRRAQVTLVS